MLVADTTSEGRISAPYCIELLEGRGRERSVRRRALYIFGSSIVEASLAAHQSTFYNILLSLQASDRIL